MTQTIDDSAIFLAHREYDPVAAREYYLRTRKLKGRKKGQGPQPGDVLEDGSIWGQPSKGRKSPLDRKRDSAAKNAKKQKIQQQVAQLEATLEQLKDILARKVEAAKARSGVETKAQKKEKQDDKKEPEKKDKKDEKLTSAEKKEKAEKAREDYEKEQRTSGAKKVQELKAEIQDVKEKIQDAIQDARESARRPSDKKSPDKTARKAVDTQERRRSA